MKSFLIIALLISSTNAFSASAENCLQAIQVMVGAELQESNYEASKDGENDCSFYFSADHKFENFMAFSDTLVVGYSSSDNIRKHTNESCKISDNKVTFSYTYKQIYEDRNTHRQSITVEKVGANKVKATVSDKEGVFSSTYKSSCIFDIH